MVKITLVGAGSSVFGYNSVLDAVNIVDYDIPFEDYYNYTASVTFRNTIIEYEPFSAHPEIPFVITPVHESDIDLDCERVFEKMHEIVEEGKTMMMEMRARAVY